MSFNITLLLYCCRRIQLLSFVKAILLSPWMRSRRSRRQSGDWDWVTVNENFILYLFTSLCLEATLLLLLYPFEHDINFLLHYFCIYMSAQTSNRPRTYFTQHMNCTLHRYMSSSSWNEEVKYQVKVYTWFNNNIRNTRI